MDLILGTFAASFAGGLFPVINFETYLAVAASNLTFSALLLALVAGIGQTTSKVVWYYAGHGTTSLPFVRRKMECEKWQRRMEKWERRTQGRPAYAGGLLAIAALSGLPPLAILAVVYGTLKANLILFVGITFVGRVLRSWMILEAAAFAWLRT